MSGRPSDEALMDEAIEVAREAMHCGEAPIGVVLYSAEGERLARGWNQRRSTGDITRHGEMVALAAAAQPGVPQPEAMVLASTLEPCVMCWGACLELKVARMVYGLEAPPNGGGDRVSDPGRRIDVAGGVRRDACRQLFVDWLTENPDHAGNDFVRRLLESTA